MKIIARLSWLLMILASPASADMEYACESEFYSENLVVFVQKKLESEGFRVGTIDGKVGQKTKTAIVRYREKHGLTASDRIDLTLLKQVLGEKYQEVYSSLPGKCRDIL